MSDTIYKQIVFRVPTRLKTDFRMVLLKNDVDVQHTLEAFVEALVAYDRGEKIPDTMKTILKRSLTLSRGL